MSVATACQFGARLLAALSLALVPAAPAHADTSDDYAACLIGRAAVVLHKQDMKDSAKALEAAFVRCKEPGDVSEAELEGIGDFATMMIEVMASGL